MGQLWLEGAEHRQTHGGWTMDGGRVAMLHHITWDSLNGDGSRLITLSGVSNYLNDKGYQPHLVIDPFTGEAICLLPADVGGSALRANNKTGSILYQIEWMFTPGTVYNGQRYESLPDTPMAGLDRVMALADSWSIPRVSPLATGDRNPDVFVNQDGHYGHFNAPSPDDHSDPVCSIQSILDHVASPPAPAPSQEELMSASMFIASEPDGKAWLCNVAGLVRHWLPTANAYNAARHVVKNTKGDGPAVEGDNLYPNLDPDVLKIWTPA